MNPSPFADLREIHNVLQRLKIPHALIGGWAVISWGVVRASDDLDFIATIPSAQRKELLDALSANYHVEYIAGDIDDPVRGLIKAKPRSEIGFPVDILASRGHADRSALSRLIPVTVDGVEIPVIRAEDIIAMKLEAGGGQDYEDVRRLLEVRAGQLDEALLAASCRERRVSDRLLLARSRPKRS